MKSFKQHIEEKRDIADINSSILRHQELALKASKKGDREAVAVHQAHIRKLRKDKVDANKVKKEYVGPALTPANQIAKKHGGKVKSIMAKDEKGKKSKMFYVEDLSWVDEGLDYSHDVVLESPDASLKKKAEKTGIPFGILKQVFNRGKAAWRTGHRPGTNPDQWGHARVNSFATKSKGTWGGADKDLAAKVRAKK